MRELSFLTMAITGVRSWIQVEDRRLILKSLKSIALCHYRLHRELFSKSACSQSACFPQESLKFSEVTFLRNDSIYPCESFHFGTLKATFCEKTGKEFSWNAAHFIIALFRYESALRLKFHTLQCESQTSLTEMRIIKQEL